MPWSKPLEERKRGDDGERKTYLVVGRPYSPVAEKGNSRKPSFRCRGFFRNSDATVTLGRYSKLFEEDARGFAQWHHSFVGRS